MPKGVKRSVGERKKLNKEPRGIGAFVLDGSPGQARG